jgi:hypothetical protein
MHKSFYSLSLRRLLGTARVGPGAASERAKNREDLRPLLAVLLICIINNHTSYEQ